MEPVTAGGIVGAVIVAGNIVVFWIRERQKHKTWKANGNGQEEIKEAVAKIDEKLDYVQTDLIRVQEQQGAQTDTCNKTVGRFDEEMKIQSQRFIDHISEKGG